MKNQFLLTQKLVHKNLKRKHRLLVFIWMRFVEFFAQMASLEQHRGASNRELSRHLCFLSNKLFPAATSIFFCD